MAYVQKNNPIPKTGCGRRRLSKMPPFKNRILKSVSKELKKASNTHAGQAEKIDKVLESSPMKGKISASCKAQAKKKFKVWPSAYASGWGVRCTRGDFKKKK
jgi:hypothetical protein